MRLREGEPRVPYAKSEALVTTAWLAEHLDDPDLRVVDGTFVMPQSGRDAGAEYADRHIPGAVFFDIDAVADRSSPLPHMMPDAAGFAAAAGALGIGNRHRVVVYDTHGLMSAARVWWMFRTFGHGAVSVLDGGLAKWLAEGRPVTNAPTVPQPQTYEPKHRPELVWAVERVRQNIADGAVQLVDARAAGRFDGSAEETWPGRRRGHIPGSLNLPYTDLLDPETMTVLPSDQLAARFRAAGVAPDRPAAATCGSGVTACVLALGLYLLGRDAVPVYDGSWAEWGLPGDLPAELGPPQLRTA